METKTIRPDLKDSFFKAEKFANNTTKVYYRYNLNVNEEPAYWAFNTLIDEEKLEREMGEIVKITPLLPYKTHAKIEYGDFYCIVTCHRTYMVSAVIAMYYCGIITN